jgi:hypothetical protein
MTNNGASSQQPRGWRDMTDDELMARYGHPGQAQYRVWLRGELIGHVWAPNWPAACTRAVRSWRISGEDQAHLVVETDIPTMPCPDSVRNLPDITDDMRKAHEDFLRALEKEARADVAKAALIAAAAWAVLLAGMLKMPSLLGGCWMMC